MIPRPISILKSLWSQRPDGRWGITDLKGLELKSNQGSDADYFKLEGGIELMSSRPGGNIHQAFASFGPTDFLMKQSIFPVVAWHDGDEFMLSVGTASVISCSGYVLTAAHVLMDPYDEGYGAVRKNNHFEVAEALNFGVLIPTSPAYGRRGLRYFPFEKFWIWGKWKESPLFHERDSFDYLTDVAICKIPEMSNGTAHQPLGLSLNPFVPGEAAYSIGYAEMANIPLDYGKGEMLIRDFKMDLYVSVGEVMSVLPENHVTRDVSTPGPCFDFKAKIPGKMSGAPIFGARGTVIRGIVSKSLSDEQHAFGAMLGPAMHLPLDEPQISGRTLQTVMEAGNDGIAQIQGEGL